MVGRKKKGRQEAVIDQHTFLSPNCHISWERQLLICSELSPCYHSFYMVVKVATEQPGDRLALISNKAAIICLGQGPQGPALITPNKDAFAESDYLVQPFCFSTVTSRGLRERLKSGHKSKRLPLLFVPGSRYLVVDCLYTWRLHFAHGAGCLQMTNG